MMTNINLIWSSQTRLCHLILHPLLFVLVTLTFHYMFVTHARNLGFTISSNTTMDKHVTNICRSTYAELRRISSIRHLLTVNATETLLSAFVLSKLNYWNSLLCDSPQFILYKLQRVQNSAARSVMKSRKCDHIQPLLRNLHWLPVYSRIDYKISTLWFSTFTDS